jgi:hypothetical protein
VASLGFSVRYQNVREVWGDVYVYTAGVKKVPEGAHSREVTQQLQSAERDILTVVKRGIYSGFVRRSSGRVRVGNWHFLRGAYYYSIRGVPVGSFIFVTGSRGHFIKVRFTYFKQYESSALKSLDGLLRDLVRVMR